jgi:hypothetical protein
MPSHESPKLKKADQSASCLEVGRHIEAPGSRRASFKQSDVTRAVKGATNGGMRVDRIEITTNGKIVILSQTSSQNAMPNPWDEVID